MASEERIIVVGAGGHARSVLDVIRSEGRYAVAGIVDSSRPRGTQWLGAEVLGDESALPDLCRELDTRLLKIKLGRVPHQNKRLKYTKITANDCGYAVAQPFSGKK